MPAIRLAYMVAALAVLTGYAAQESQPELENEEGWQWLLGPWDCRLAMLASSEMVVLIDPGREDELVVTVGRYLPQDDQIIDVRAVAFDSRGQRHVLESRMGGSSGRVSMMQFRSRAERLKSEDARYVGIEGLDRAGQRLIAKKAQAQAREAGIEVLPFPELNQPLDFRLTAADGRKLSAAELRGKVVLLDCWATWCTPCMQKMPRLKELYEKWHGRGPEIIGINFDQDAEIAQAACQKPGLAWPRVQVPAEEQVRRLWWEAAGIRGLPRLFLIDRQGILRADCQPHELEKELEKLLSN